MGLPLIEQCGCGALVADTGYMIEQFHRIIGAFSGRSRNPARGDGIERQPLKAFGMLCRFAQDNNLAPNTRARALKLLAHGHFNVDRMGGGSQSMDRIVAVLSPWFGRWRFPLPQALTTLCWEVDCLGEASPVSIENLVDPDFVAGLDTTLHDYCWHVVDYWLRVTLRTNALPPQLLDLPVTRKGHPKSTLRNRLNDIGSCPIKLLQWMENAPTLRQTPGFMPVRLDIPVEALNRAADAVLTDRTSLGLVASRRQRRRTSQLDRFEWLTKRLEFSAETQVQDGNGHVVTARDPRFGRDLVIAETSTDEAAGHLLRDRLRLAFHNTLSNELLEIASTLLPDRVDRKKPRIPHSQLLGHLFGVDGLPTFPRPFTHQHLSMIRRNFLARAKEGTLYAPVLHWVSGQLSHLHEFDEENIRNSLGDRLGSMSVQGAVKLVNDLGRIQPGWDTCPDATTAGKKRSAHTEPA